MKLFFCRSDAEQCFRPVNLVNFFARRESKTSPLVSRRKSKLRTIDRPASMP